MEIEAEFQRIHVVVLTGTQRRAAASSKEREYLPLDQHWAFELGHSSLGIGPEAAGITTMFWWRAFKPRHIGRVYDVPSELLGRVAAVEFGQRFWKIFVGMFFPPRKSVSKEKAAVFRLVHAMIGWLNRLFEGLTTRHSLYIHTDLRDGD